MSQSGVVGPSIWVVSDGRAGIERQALALAEALGDMSRWPQIAHIRSEAHRDKPVRLSPRAPQLWLPPDRWPDPLGALPADQRNMLSAPWPDLWIGSGRRAVPYSMRVREWSKGKTLVVQTQDPKAPLDGFDLVVPPEHDQLMGDNVMPILGAPSHFSTAALEEAALKFPELGATPGLRLAVIIGGKSKTHDVPASRAVEIVEALSNLARQGVKLWISASRRTPRDMRMALRNLAVDVGARFFEDEAVDGPNPYLGYLSQADMIMVTEDSSNMISEAAWFGKPLYLLRLHGRSDKFDRLHAGFIERGHAPLVRWQAGHVGNQASA